MKLCKKCNKEFNPKIIINGKKHLSYGRTFCFECSPFGNHNTKDITRFNKNAPFLKDGKKYKICSVCDKELEFNNKNYYINSKGKYHAQCKLCGKKKTLKKLRDMKFKCVEYKGGKCNICGYNKYAGALQFHHRNPDEKEFSISDAKTFNWDKITKELDKCDLLCANCHAEVEGGKLLDTDKVDGFIYNGNLGYNEKTKEASMKGIFQINDGSMGQIVTATWKTK